MRFIGEASVLAGAVRGKQAFVRLVDHLSGEPAGPTHLFLDFKHIELATASYLRESVLAFRDYVRDRRPSYYPVVANLNDVVTDEFLELVRSRREVIVSCALEDDGRVTKPALIGELETKQRITFDLVNMHREVEAATLMRDYGDTEGTTRTTAWNNRLASLSALGLIIEDSRGRAKSYRSLFEDLKQWA